MASIVLILLMRGIKFHISIFKFDFPSHKKYSTTGVCVKNETILRKKWDNFA